MALLSGFVSLRPAYGSNLGWLGIESIAYGSSFLFKRSRSRVSGNIRMQSLQMPSQNALHIKKQEAVMDANDFICCSRNISSTPDNPAIRVPAEAEDDIVAAAIRMADAMGFTLDSTDTFSGSISCKPYLWKAKTLQKYCCPGGGPDLIVDDVTLLIHEAVKGVKVEEEFAKTRKLPDPESTTNLEFQNVLGLIKESIKVDPLRYHRMDERLVGLFGETTTIVRRLNQMQDSGALPFPAINVNGPFTKIKLDDLNGCRASFLYGPMRATDAMIAGNVAVWCGYGDVGKPFCAVKPLMEALPEDVFHTADIFVTTTSNKYIIMLDHMRKMKNNTIVCNIGLAEGPLMNLGCATGHPSFVMSCSFTKQAAYINVPAEGPYNTEEK